jgi:hypothetical protein
LSSAYGDQCFFAAYPFSQLFEFYFKCASLRAGGSPGCLNKNSFEIAIAFGNFSAFYFTGTLIIARTKAGPSYHLAAAFKNVHVCTFEHFKEDSLSRDPFSIISTTKDSLFKISIPKTDSFWNHHLPFAVVDDGKYYIQIIDSFYLQAEKLDSTFYFYVPWTLTDMYALLSIEEIKTRNSSTIPPSGNIVTDILGSVAAILIDDIAKTSEERKIMKEGLKHSFRHCVINMNSGDFIYSNSKSDYRLQ